MSDATEATMRAFHNGVITALHELDKRNYAGDDAVVYAHPQTWTEAKHNDDTDTAVVADSDELPTTGHTVLTTHELPEGIVLAANVRFVQRGHGDALAFAEVEADA